MSVLRNSAIDCRPPPSSLRSPAAGTIATIAAAPHQAKPASSSSVASISAGSVGSSFQSELIASITRVVVDAAIDPA